MTDTPKNPGLQKKVATLNRPGGKGDVYGVAPAVQVGSRIYVAGQTASDPNGDMEAQMREAYSAIEAALQQLGAGMANVVDETLFVTDMDAAGQCAAKVRSEVFAGCFEFASTLVGTTRLGHPDIMIEIKCTAEI